MSEYCFLRIFWRVLHSALLLVELYGVVDRGLNLYQHIYRTKRNTFFILHCWPALRNGPSWLHAEVFASSEWGCIGSNIGVIFHPIIQQSGQKKASQKKQRKYNAYKFNIEKQHEQKKTKFMFEMKTTIRIFHWELLEVPKIGLRACKPGFGNCVVALSSPIETEPRFNQKIDQSQPASWNLQWQWSDFFTGKKSTYIANFHICHFYYDLNFRYIDTKYCSKPF